MSIALFGSDFSLRGPFAYPQQKLQGLWRGLGFFALLMIVNGALQVGLGFAIFKLVFHGDYAAIADRHGAAFADLAKSGVIGVFPGALIVFALGLWLKRYGLQGRRGDLPLRMPSLGAVGWIVVILVFAIFMYAFFAVGFTVLGIDPAAYAPTSAGLADDKSLAGIVEKTIAGMVHQPWQFALALPSLILGAPLAEEITFRGFLFSAIVKTPLGKTGAVVISSALWALAHGGGAPVLFLSMLFVMGLVLGVLLLRFGSLWVTIACHAAWNSFAAIGLLAAGLSS